jgi:hypothetical protein
MLKNTVDDVNNNPDLEINFVDKKKKLIKSENVDTASQSSVGKNYANYYECMYIYIYIYIYNNFI